jgi:hypothetical protein
MKICPNCRLKINRDTLEDHTCEALVRISDLKRPLMFRPFNGRGTRAGLAAIAAKHRRKK